MFDHYLDGRQICYQALSLRDIGSSLINCKRRIAGRCARTCNLGLSPLGMPFHAIDDTALLGSLTEDHKTLNNYSGE